MVRALGGILLPTADAKDARASVRYSFHNGEPMTEDGIIPANFQVLYTPEEIAEKIRFLGAQIDQWAKEIWDSSHTDILAIPILRGGIFFFADLVRNIRHSVEIASARTWAYETDQRAVQKAKVEVNITEVPAKGRAVLLVDDICDSGKTLHALTQALLGSGARVVKSAALVRREVKDQVFAPDWAGFEYQGSEWMVGYGMDDCDRWRNLPGIYIIRQS